MTIVPQPVLPFHKSITDIMMIDAANCCCREWDSQAQILKLPCNALSPIYAV